MDTRELGRQVLKRRQRLGLSQGALAEKAYLSRNYISLIERGEAQNVSMNIVSQLGTALGASPSELMGEVEEEETLIPPALRELARQEKLSFEIVDKLARIPRRGKEPKTVEDWRKMYNLLKKYVQDS
jgi:transcriptional regulator with XRE-family HTH domain